jgi:serine/threonine protein phosphatase PrpC
MLKSNQINTIYRAEYSKRFKYPTTWILESSKKYLEVENGEWTLAGHDSTLVVKNVGDNPDQYLLGVADGHGEMGDSFSYIAIHLLANELKKTINPIKELIKNQPLENAQDMINDICKTAYVNTHALLCTKTIFPHLDHHSGTTMAMAMILIIDNNRYLISTNAGDSQILWSNSYDSVEECSMDHNCDNPKAVQLYIQRMSKLRQVITDKLETECECDELDNLEDKRNKLLPKPIYYSRINCPGGPKWPIYDDNGKPCPIEVYEYIGDNQEELKLNNNNYEKVSKYYPHGQQSIRCPETYIREDGRVVAKPGCEMDNWGSTLAGGGQTLNGFGDIHEFPHRSVHPHVLVKPINETGKLIIASDGLTDLFYFNNLMNWFWEQTEQTEDIDTNFYQHIFNTSKNHEQFEYTTIDSTKYPKWDDFSGVFLSLDKYPPTEKIVYPQQHILTPHHIIDIPSPSPSPSPSSSPSPYIIDDLIINVNESTPQPIIDNDRLVYIAKCLFNYGYE